MSLPIATIRELELSWSYRERATLGDGSEVLFDICDGMVIWGGQYREIEINAAETEPLIGMSLLRGYRLQVDTVQGGLVTISELPIAEADREARSNRNVSAMPKALGSSTDARKPYCDR